ncbi:MAG: DUF4290 domain-containing protein [Bacteroidia bacterium]|nr:DUF4290 domain-containing protein [Bacteroidia bacterium]
MKYKISDTPLKLREYGRNVQSMVEHARTIQDDDMRNALVHSIIRYMANINPTIQEQPEYEAKLWDALYFLADYNIKVDSEYPMPAPDSFQFRPTKRMEYSQLKPTYRQYGSNIDLMVKEAVYLEEGDRKHQLVNLIANIMKMQLRTDERDVQVEPTVLEHLRVLSKGKIAPSMEDIDWYKGPAKNTFARQNQIVQTSNKKRKKGRKNRY